MGEILVCKEEQRIFTIRNTSRISAVYRVLNDTLPDNCEVFPNTGKIPSEGQVDLTVKYNCGIEQELNSDIQVLIRGGKILKVPFSVRTVVPKIEILESAFNFGKMTTLGNTGAMDMTLVNNSIIGATLVLDMRTEEENPECPDGIECL